MPKLADLGIGNEKIAGVDFSEMPEQRGGGMQDPPQPGTYRLKLPMFDLNSPIFDAIESQDGKRVNIAFTDAFALQIVQSPGGAHNGEELDYRFSNVAFNQARKGQPEMKVSDLDFLLRDAFKDTGRPKTNAAYVQALAKHAGKEFTVDLEFTWSCNPKRDIYVDDGTGQSTKVEGTMGCGARYYQGGAAGIQKEHENPEDANSPMVYPVRITCGGKDGVPCGAIVRAFPRLRNFRA